MSAVKPVLRALCGRPGRRNTLPGPFRTDDTGAMSSDRVIGRCWSSCGYVACRSDRQGKAQSSARVTGFVVSPERAQTASAVQHLAVGCGPVRCLFAGLFVALAYLHSEC